VWWTEAPPILGVNQFDKFRFLVVGFVRPSVSVLRETTKTLGMRVQQFRLKLVSLTYLNSLTIANTNW
jgi:hypothetical protein